MPAGNRQIKAGDVFSAILVVAPLHIAAGGGVMPSQLLEDRARTLLSPPELSFAEEVLRLVRPPGYTPPRLVVRDWWRTAADERMEQDLESVGQSGLLRIEAMRSAASEREAVDLGAQLPAAIRRYTLGARASSRCKRSIGVSPVVPWIR